MTYLYLVEKERFNEGFMVIKEIRGEWGFMCSIQCDYSKEHKEIFPNVRSDIFGLHLLQTEIRLDTEDDEDYCFYHQLEGREEVYVPCNEHRCSDTHLV